MCCPTRLTHSCLLISDRCPSQAIKLFTSLKVIPTDPHQIHKALPKQNRLPKKQVRVVIWLHFISIPLHVWVNISSFLCNFLATEIAPVISVWLERFWCETGLQSCCQEMRELRERDLDSHLIFTLAHKLSHAQPWTQWCENEGLPKTVSSQAWTETPHKKLNVRPPD